MDTPTAKAPIDFAVDQHDLSALSNLVDMDAALAALEGAGPMRRLVLACGIYKNLVDLMVHLAPAVHAREVVRSEPFLPWPFTGAGHAVSAVLRCHEAGATAASRVRTESCQ